jgi:serine-type D-Ala-D-Ala carboxypeptidase (penicillin-binding protein 5/6)
LGAHGSIQPQPMASTAKILTAWVILQDHPLALREPGPTVAVTAQDVADYQAAVRDGQSAVPVRVGQPLSEYQLLQGLLLPSGNNVATMLARWNAGSEATFVARLNAEAAALGLTATHFADASGYSPRTVSTPVELIKIAEAALAEPVFAEIVAQPQANLPVAGLVYNVNAMLGQGGIVGIKTGSTPEAGGCFVFAAEQTAKGQPVMILGAVMGQPRLADAFEAAKQLTMTVREGLQEVELVAGDQPVAVARPPWGSDVEIVPDEAVTLRSWPGLPVHATLALVPLHAPLPAGAAAGVLTLQVGEMTRQVSLHTRQTLPSPPLHWRLTRPPQ